MNMLISDNFIKEYCRLRGHDLIDNVTVDEKEVKSFKDIAYLNNLFDSYYSLMLAVQERTGFSMLNHIQN